MVRLKFYLDKSNKVRITKEFCVNYRPPRSTMLPLVRKDSKENLVSFFPQVPRKSFNCTWPNYLPFSFKAPTLKHFHQPMNDSSWQTIDNAEFVENDQPPINSKRTMKEEMVWRISVRNYESSSYPGIERFWRRFTSTFIAFKYRPHSWLCLVLVFQSTKFLYSIFLHSFLFLPFVFPSQSSCYM